MVSGTMCRRSCRQKDQEEPVNRRKQGSSKSCRGRSQGRRTGEGGWTRGRSHHHLHHHPQHHHLHHHPHHPQHQHHHTLQRQVMSLRPVNVKGRLAKGMRAPKNTNQFLMHEKYQMLHLRSDSVGSDSAFSSDSDSELTDMDSYLGILENARGALLGSPDPHGSSTATPGQVLVLDHLQLHEDSMQYFPSEDDLMQSQNFMQRDFVQFCDILTS